MADPNLPILQASRNDYLGHVTRAVAEVHRVRDLDQTDDNDAELELVLARLEIRWNRYEEFVTTVLRSLNSAEDGHAAQYQQVLDQKETRRDKMTRARTFGDRWRRQWENIKERAQSQAAAARAPRTPPAAPRFHMGTPHINFQIQPPELPRPNRLTFKPLKPEAFKGEYIK